MHRHICVVGHVANMRRDVPSGTRFETICLPGHDVLCMEVTRGLNHVAKNLKIVFNHKDLMDELYKLCGDLYHAGGFQDSRML